MERFTDLLWPITFLAILAAAPVLMDAPWQDVMLALWGGEGSGGWAAVLPADGQGTAVALVLGGEGSGGTG